jgi:predicted MFS family arabinose efflux permease
MQGKIEQLSIGNVNNKKFIQMAGLGFDAHVVRDVSKSLKNKIGKLAYVYEFCGVITNITGGYLAKRFGLNKTMFSGIFLQIVALTLLFNINSTWTNCTLWFM